MREEWQSPSQLLALVNKEANGVPKVRLFNAPDYQKWRDKWGAARFTSALESLGIEVRVRLAFDQADEADFEVLAKDRILPFQLTEAQKPHRERGKEYKEREKKPVHLTPYEPQRGMQEGPSWVARAVKKKSAKNYAIPPHLIVYANFEAESLDVTAVADCCMPYKPHFLSFWLLQSHRVIQVWQSKDTKGWAKGWVYFSDN